MKNKDENQVVKEQGMEKGLKPMFSNTSMPPVKMPKKSEASSFDDKQIENKAEINNESE